MSEIKKPVREPKRYTGRWPKHPGGSVEPKKDGELVYHYEYKWRDERWRRYCEKLEGQIMTLAAELNMAQNRGRRP